MERIPEEVRVQINVNREDPLVLKEIARSFVNDVLLDELESELLRDVANRDTSAGLWYKVLKQESLWRMSRASK